MINNHPSSLGKEILKLLGIKNPDKEQLAIINAFVDNMVVNTPVKFDRRLTQREQFCLYWSAKGKSSIEAAQLLHVKKSTIDCYKKRIIRKLCCANMTQAVYEGIKLGIFCPYL